MKGWISRACMADGGDIRYMSDFRQRTIAGISWSLVSQVGRQGLLFLIGVILARLLSPDEFGLVAMVTVITNFGNIFAELGFSGALIQKQDVTDEHLSSVFWLNLGIGITLMAITMLGAPLIADFYDEPLLISLTVVLSVNFLIASLNIVQNTLLVKSLNFRVLSIVEIVSVLLSGGVAIWMSYVGCGVWSLIAQTLLLSGITALLLWVLTRWRPRVYFRWTAVKDLLGFSTSMLGTDLLNYWVRNIDYLLIGRFLGTNPLGVYNRAYSIMLFPLTNVSRVFARVMFPSFSIIQDDRERIRRIYLKITRSIALLTFPMMLGLFVEVEPFVMAVFGPKWIDMIQLLRVFCIVGMVQSIVTLNGNLYLSQGRADLQLKVGFILRLILIAGIVVGLRWGIFGVTIGYGLASLINMYPNIYFAGKLVGVTFSDLIRNLLPVLTCSILMAFLMWCSALLIPNSWSYWTQLVIQTSLGLVSYFMLLKVMRVLAYQDLRDTIISQMRLVIRKVPAK